MKKQQLDSSERNEAQQQQQLKLISSPEAFNYHITIKLEHNPRRPRPEHGPPLQPTLTTAAEGNICCSLLLLTPPSSEGFEEVILSSHVAAFIFLKHRDNEQRSLGPHRAEQSRAERLSCCRRLFSSSSSRIFPCSYH
ncbi:unnamed protein product [Pleuronectes platessa]|uniref:Uncharacterized protein n=1 Tax=Pleuronectes platessa TaxID=8262 RepID=A0A9N7U4X8_PLEPL|nr:unnamed protein product [Pleuronectes platessa]